MLYPDTFWGSISSSGVTEAIIDYWQYWEPIRLFGPQDCIKATQDFVEVIDGILIDNPSSTATLKNTFGLGNVTDDADFAAALTEYGIGGWQSRNWDPDVSSPVFQQYCGNVSNTSVIYPETEALRPAVVNLTETAEFSGGARSFSNQMLNFIDLCCTEFDPRSMLPDK